MDEKDSRFEDPRFEMFDDNQQFWAIAKVYGIAFAIVIFIVMPWGIGLCMMAKWGFQIIF